MRRLVVFAVNVSVIFFNTGTADETYHQSEKEDSSKHIFTRNTRSCDINKS